MPFSVEYVPYKSCYFACRSKTLTSCSDTHVKNKKMRIWEFIKKSQTACDQSLKKSSCKSRMCTSKILDFAAFWNEEKHTAVKLHIDIFFSPMTDELRRCGQQKLSYLKSTCTNKRTRRKALCISKYAQFSFLCNVASLQHFPTVIHLGDGKRGVQVFRPDLKENASNEFSEKVRTYVPTQCLISQCFFVLFSSISALVSCFCQDVCARCSN